MTAPAYVTHDGKRWHVQRQARVDGAPAYVLRDPRGRTILARCAECETWRPPAERVRILRAGAHVLEVRAAGGVVRSVAVRRARSSKRHDTSIEAIYSMTVKAETARRKRVRKGRI